jgi:hypothetical protein
MLLLIKVYYNFEKKKNGIYLYWLYIWFIHEKNFLFYLGEVRGW